MSLLSPLPANDAIYLRDLALTAIIAPGDAWSRALKPTPVRLSLRVLLAHRGLALPAATDDVAHTISYGALAKHVTAAITAHAAYASLRAFATHVGEAALQLGGSSVEVRAELPEALLLGESVAIESSGADDAVLVLQRLRVACVVGVNPHEREQKQWVIFNIRLGGVSDGLWTGYPEAARRVVEVSAGGRAGGTLEAAADRKQVVEVSSYLTIESLATEVAGLLLREFDVEVVTVAVEKPSALTFAAGSGVEITRQRRDMF